MCMDIGCNELGILALHLSLLNNPSSRGIGLAKKTATDDVQLSNRVMLSCDADPPHVF
jgi:hypothetical protein